MSSSYIKNSYYYNKHNKLKSDSIEYRCSKNNNDIFETLTGHLINAGEYCSPKDAAKDLAGNRHLILDKCRNIMSTDQADVYDKIVNAISKEDEVSNKLNDEIVLYTCTGVPGTGKSFVQDTINAYCQNKNIRTTIVAPTNLIAYQQGGVTLNVAVKDFLNMVFNLPNNSIDELIIQDVFTNKFSIDDKFLENQNLREASLPILVKTILDCAKPHLLKYYYSKFASSLSNKKTNVVLIDEGSMITNVSMATLMASAVPKYRNIYVLFYGENQIPPVSPTRFLKSCYLVQPGSYLPPGGENKLKTMQRFRDDNDNNKKFKSFILYFNDKYFDSKNTIIDLDAIYNFEREIRIGGNLKDYRELKEEKILIVALNEYRVKENNLRLNQEGEGKIFEIPAIIDSEIRGYYDTYKQFGIDRMLRIRKGCVCICRANLHGGLVKGTMLRVEDIETDTLSPNDVISVTVSFLFDNSEDKEKIKLSRHLFETTFKKNRKTGEVASIQQFPITVGYAITAHGAQGKTLTCKVGIDIKSFNNWDILLNIFFVAITRVREPSQLYMDTHPACWIMENYNSDMIFEKNYKRNNEDCNIGGSSSKTSLDFFKSYWENDYNKNDEKRRKICGNTNGVIDDTTHKKIISIYPS